MQLDEDTIIGDLLDYDQTCEEVLYSLELNCMDCPAARGETLGEACEIHGIDAAVLLGKLRRHLDK